MPDNATSTADSLKQYRMYIGGEFVEPLTDATITSVNPTTGTAWYQAADADDRDVDRAVRAARQAAQDPAWRDMPPSARGRLLRRVAEETDSLSGRLAEIETRDNGKLIREIRAQHLSLPSTWEYFAGWPDKIRGAQIPLGPGTHDYVVREPVGVIATIIPWNSPLQMATIAMAPALAAGNAIVIKPSEHTSASLLEYVCVLEAAGVPKGLVNVITGFGGTAGRALASHPGVDLITFTGGTATGRQIAHYAAERTIPVILELGGKSPNIVFADADLDRAAAGIVSGIFAAGGQTCVAGSRCFVQRGVYDEVMTLVVAHAQRVRLGDPLSDESDMGPLAFEGHMNRVLSYVESGREEGAIVRVGGKRAGDPALASGFFVEPTILEQVTNDMRVAREEIFGPVLSVIPFDTEDEVIRVANDTPFGLAAGVWTTSLGRAHRVAAALNAGQVWVNTYRALSSQAPFGGFGWSGYGKQGGEEIMHAYTRQKNVWMDISDDHAADPFVMRLR
jgi:(Z)-2-((N-methylformamido)methylene)-5-hydroxybutyrolactone dehydrogenase